jgi:hypothetical protein
MHITQWSEGLNIVHLSTLLLLSLPLGNRGAASEAINVPTLGTHTQKRLSAGSCHAIALLTFGRRVHWALLIAKAASLIYVLSQYIDILSSR